MKIEHIKGNLNPPQLSILICTLEERKEEFLDRLLGILIPQIQDKDVEIVILTDRGEMPIGTKRNLALDNSNGKYVCFVDDDDLVSDDYVSLILEKSLDDRDVIVFSGVVTTNGAEEKFASQGIEYEHCEKDGVYYRLPNHLSVHKKSTMVERFLDIRTGEDDEWAKRRLKEIKSQSRINKVIYHYDFRTTTKKYFMNELEPIDNLFDITINRPQYLDEGNIRLNFPYFEHFEKVFKDHSFNFMIYDKFDRIVWSSNNMSLNHFSYWPGITWTRVEIVDNFGNLIWTWKWDPIKDGCICHQIFHLWSMQNKNSFGIVIGTHDGCTGEWVGSVDEGRLQSLLIEASTPQFEKLKERYGGKPWVKLEQNLITVGGGHVKFYEGGRGYTNSIYKDHILETGVNDFIESERQSESLISLLERNPNCDWLHIDVEGIDDYLILSLKGRPELLPKLIIYEHENLSKERESNLIDFLKLNGFSIYKSKSRNSIALK